MVSISYSLSWSSSFVVRRRPVALVVVVVVSLCVVEPWMNEREVGRQSRTKTDDNDKVRKSE